MPEEAASPEAQDQLGIPAGLVLQILQQRAARDKELALHLESATLQAANQLQQTTIQQLIAEKEAEPAPAKAPAKRKPAAKKK